MQPMLLLHSSNHSKTTAKVTCVTGFALRKSRKRHCKKTRQFKPGWRAQKTAKWVILWTVNAADAETIKKQGSQVCT